MEVASPDRSPLVQQALLEVLRAVPAGAVEDFEKLALRSLGRLAGFDGAVWGTGLAAGDGLSITRASVVDRPPTLLSEYPMWAGLDPMTRRFLQEPGTAVRATVSRDYATRALAPVGDYLQRHGVAHLLLVGDSSHASPARRWLTVYRDAGPAFSRCSVRRLRSLLPLWNQARELCLASHMERLARGIPSSGAGLALADAAGLVHAADEKFAGWTALRPGQAWPGSAQADAAVEIQVREAGDWRLLVARPLQAGHGLPPRELAVARHYAEGASHKAIARLLGTSPSTVRTQLQNVFRRLDVHSRSELRRALADG